MMAPNRRYELSTEFRTPSCPLGYKNCPVYGTDCILSHLAALLTRISFLKTQRQPSANLQRQY